MESQHICRMLTHAPHTERRVIKQFQQNNNNTINNLKYTYILAAVVYGHIHIFLFFLIRWHFGYNCHFFE